MKRLLIRTGNNEGANYSFYPEITEGSAKLTDIADVSAWLDMKKQIASIMTLPNRNLLLNLVGEEPAFVMPSADKSAEWTNKVVIADY